MGHGHTVTGVRMEQFFHPVTERSAGAQHCLEVLGTGTIYMPCFVRNTGDLVEVATDGPKLGDRSLELGKLPVWNPCDAPQVSPKHDRGIRGGSHPPARGTLPQ